MLAISLYAFDDLAMSTLLPVVAEELHGDGLYGASFLAFLLTNLAGLVATGYFIDRLGVPRPFAIGIALFVAGLMLGCWAGSMTVFVLGRALQGLGGGAIQAVVSATIVIAWRGADRQRAISWATTSWMVPALIGPLLAGWTAEALDWRYVFAGLALLAVLTTAIALPRLLQVGAPSAAAASDVDEAPPPLPLPFTAVIHSLAIATGTGTLLYGLDLGNWTGAALMLAGVLIVWHPLAASLPARCWMAGTPLAAALMLRLLACAVFFGIEAWLPWTVVRGGLGSTTLAGLIISCSAFGWTASTWWVDSAIARSDSRRILLVAAVLMLLGTGLAWLAATVTAQISVLFLAWTIAGFAMGLIYPIVTMLAMAQAEPGREGHLSMMLGLADTLGITAAIGLGGALLQADSPAALSRIGSVWLGLFTIAALMPVLLLIRGAQFSTRDLGAAVDSA